MARQQLFLWLLFGQTLALENVLLDKKSLRGSPPQPQSRIVGGHQADANAYPFHVQWQVGCGGTLIHDDLVLTAVSYC